MCATDIDPTHADFKTNNRIVCFDVLHAIWELQQGATVKRIVVNHSALNKHLSTYVTIISCNALLFF